MDLLWTLVRRYLISQTCLEGRRIKRSLFSKEEKALNNQGQSHRIIDIHSISRNAKNYIRSYATNSAPVSMSESDTSLNECEEVYEANNRATGKKDTMQAYLRSLTEKFMHGNRTVSTSCYNILLYYTH